MPHRTAHADLAALRQDQAVAPELHPDPVTSRQMNYLADCITQLQAQVAEGADRMAAVERELRTNTETTLEVRDILGAAKGAFKFFNGLGLVLKWVGGLATAAVAVYTLWHMANHGGKPPGST